MKAQTFSSFKELAQTMHRQDIERADRLRRSSALRRGKPRSKTGPAVAR